MFYLYLIFFLYCIFLYFIAETTLIHSFCSLSPLIFPFLLPFKFMASFYINYCCMHIYMYICIPKYNLLHLYTATYMCIFRGDFSSSIDLREGSMSCDLSSVHVEISVIVFRVQLTCSQSFCWDFLGVESPLGDTNSQIQDFLQSSTSTSTLFSEPQVWCVACRWIH